MCGIIAYKGKDDATNIVIDGLKKLEYRGYDSWGIATLDKDLNLHKEVGRIGEFNTDKLKLGKSFVALGHTRWATHGGVTISNAHPQLDCKKEIIVVHNGIIENYQEIKQELIKKGHKFSSETDTEVIAHFIEENINLGIRSAVVKLAKTIEGRNAIVFFYKPTKQIFALKKGAPLVLGVSKQGYFVASDIPAFIEHTRNVIFLDDDEGVEINKGATIFNTKTGKDIDKKIEEVNWNFEQAKKGKYESFTIKEIMQQSETIRLAAVQDEDKIKELSSIIKEAYGSFLIGCGTASYAALLGTYYFSKIAKKHLNFVVASEFLDHQHFLTDKSLVIAVSQSGETADILEAVETAKKHNAKIACVVNVMGSSLMRKSDYPFLMRAGPEISVISTKAFTSQIAVLLLLAYVSANRLNEGKRLLEETSEKIKGMLKPEFLKNIEELAEKLKNKQHIYVIGKGSNYPIALETALKIKEMSYIHAEGFASGELKHGVIALIEKGTPCIAIVSNDEHKNDVLSGAIEIKSRGGSIIGISPENNPAFDYWINVPDCGYASPIVNTIPAQLLAHNLAKLLKRDLDKPRNLAKSVTVK
ncbi:hypothetical protein A3K72_03735 [Candidatus Woesearchaeota archaeon RBG_13_36_6]|nr:MAG: hypothetical protein A3K72_03735 [Candidatus Woesearchaeota archaeon RBG_13_36_6]